MMRGLRTRARRTEIFGRSKKSQELVLGLHRDRASSSEPKMAFRD